MTAILSEFISALLQILLFSIIPFIFFLFRKDKSIGFLKWIGFYKPTSAGVIYSIVGSLIFLFSAVGVIYFDESIRQMVFAPQSVTGKLRLLGLSPAPVVILLIASLLKTSLSEELFFRGFVAKRLIAKFGFGSGNFIQSLIFGIIHLVLFRFLIHATLGPLVFIFVLSTAGAWATGYINEKVAEGSIIPGWIAHGLGNALSYFIIAFVL